MDTVSGATYSSVGIIEAVRNALSQAAVSDDSSNSDKPQEPETSTENHNPDISGTIPYKDGVYSGSADGYWGEIKVSVTIQSKTIKEIKILESEDDEAFFNRAKAVIDNVIKKQSTDVDVVSGATYSSNGILGAIENALKEAERVTNGEKPSVPSIEDTSSNTENTSSSTEESSTENTSSSTEESSTENTSSSTEESSTEDTSSSTEESSTEEGSTESGDNQNNVYRDGDYIVSAVCMPDEDEDFENYNLSLKLTIKDDKIVQITDIAGDGDDGNDSYIKRAANGTSKLPGVVTQILQKGTLDGIDTVSRATCSSNAILEACRRALESARVK